MAASHFCLVIVDGNLPLSLLLLEWIANFMLVEWIVDGVVAWLPFAMSFLQAAVLASAGGGWPPWIPVWVDGWVDGRWPPYAKCIFAGEWLMEWLPLTFRLSGWVGGWRSCHLRSNFNSRKLNSRELVQSFQLYSKRLSSFLTIFGHKITLFFL